MAIKINGVTVIDDSRVGTLVSATATGNVVGGNVTTGGLISATGNITGNYLFGNGSQLQGIDATSIQSGTSNVRVVSSGGNVAVGVGGTSNVAVWATTGEYVTGLISATGNITGSYILGNGSLLTGIDATSIQSGTSNVRVVSSGGNVAVGIGGTSNVLVLSSTGAYVTGLTSVTGNVIAGNVSGTNLTGTNASVTGTVTGASVVGGVMTGSSVSVTGTVTGASVVGGVMTGTSVSVTGNVNANNIIGGGFTLSGNTISSSGSTLTIDPATSGIEGTVVIAGNLSVTGNVTYIDSTTITTNEKDIVLANNVNTQASVNGAGLLLGNNSVVTFTYNNTSNAWVSNVGLSAAGTVTGASVVGGVMTGSSVSVTGTVTGASVVGGVMTGTSLSTTGNVSTGADLNLTGNIVDSGALTVITGSNGNIALAPNGTGMVTASGAISAVGNITGGNIAATNHTGTTVSVTGTITGASVVGGVMTGSSVSVTGTVTGASVVGGVMTGSSVSVTGAITGGAITGSSLNITTGTANVGSITNANANGVGNIGNSTVYFNTIFAKATSAQYADLAEMYEADQMIDPGTVVCFGGTREVTVCSEDSSRRVAGVVSTNPSYIMNAGLSGDHVVAVALTGRVPTKVTGTVRKGDMLVAAGDGRARADANPAVGAVIGKALADFDGADGTIEVVVGRL